MVQRTYISSGIRELYKKQLLQQKCRGCSNYCKQIQIVGSSITDTATINIKLLEESNDEDIDDLFDSSTSVMQDRYVLTGSTDPLAQTYHRRNKWLFHNKFRFIFLHKKITHYLFG